MAQAVRMRGGPQLRELLHIWPLDLLPAALFVLAQLGSFDKVGPQYVSRCCRSKRPRSTMQGS